MASNYGALISILFFMIFLGWILGEMTGTSYILLNPITWLALTGAMVGAIAVSNTPVAKGVAMAVIFGVLISVLFVDMFFNQMSLLWGLLFVPLYLILGFEFLEVGKS